MQIWPISNTDLVWIVNNGNDDEDHDAKDDNDKDIILLNQVVTAADCAKQCAEEPQCHGWSHFAPAKRYNDDPTDDKIQKVQR